MPRPFTLERLIALSPEQRLNLYNNARRLDTDEARATVILIEESGLSLKEGGGLPADHWAIRKIDEVVTTPDARAAMRDAAARGLPALAGVDGMLQAALGDYYGQFDTTGWAGTYVAREMYAMGYRKVVQRSLPPGLVAKSGSYFEPR